MPLESPDEMGDMDQSDSQMLAEVSNNTQRLLRHLEGSMSPDSPQAAQAPDPRALQGAVNALRALGSKLQKESVSQ